MKRWQQDEETRRVIERLKKMRRDIADVEQSDDMHVVQKDMVNDLFKALALSLEGAIRPQLQIFFNTVAAHPDKKFDVIANMLACSAGNQPGGFKTVIPTPLPLNTDYIKLTSAELKELPGYIMLHKAARTLDVAIKIAGVTVDESDEGGGRMQPMLLIDITKGYAEGAAWNAGFYPDLPAVRAVAERKLPVEIRETITRKKLPKPGGNSYTLD